MEPCGGISQRLFQRRQERRILLWRADGDPQAALQRALGGIEIFYQHVTVAQVVVSSRKRRREKEVLMLGIGRLRM